MLSCCQTEIRDGDKVAELGQMLLPNYDPSVSIDPSVFLWLQNLKEAALSVTLLLIFLTYAYIALIVGQ